MLYPSIQELLKVTSNENGEKLNKYSLVMATAKCARIITNDYAQQRHDAEKKENKDDKDAAALVNKDYRDEKAVKNALRDMNDGEFEVYLPGEEGYENATVVVENYKEPQREIPKYIPLSDKKEDEEKEEEADDNFGAFDDADTSELMGASDVFETEKGYTVGDAEEILGNN